MLLRVTEEGAQSGDDLEAYRLPTARVGSRPVLQSAGNAHDPLRRGQYDAAACERADEPCGVGRVLVRCEEKMLQPSRVRTVGHLGDAQFRFEIVGQRRALAGVGQCHPS